VPEADIVGGVNTVRRSPSHAVVDSIVASERHPKLLLQAELLAVPLA
jgi:hypothetical protein